jgi:penicillin-binding protein 2A
VLGNHWRMVIIVLGFVFMLPVVIVVIWFSSLDISKLENPLPESTYIYDHKGMKVSELSASRIEPVSLDRIPQHLQNAIVAIEDRRFYDHPGVDLRSIARAFVKNVQSGEITEGGSTINQQLTKNLFLSSDQTLSRKLSEAAYSLKIDLSYNKEQILELYLNNIYFGEGSWGVQAASKKYFAKDVYDLSLEEAALLAALPKAPTHYSPLNNKEKALERRNLVLSLMKDQDYITIDQFNTAIAQPIVVPQDYKEQLKGKYGSYVDHVIEEAINLYGFTEDQLLKGGLQIYTHMDLNVQNAAQDVYNDPQFFPESKDDQLIQSGTVILDHHTGGIRAIVGHRGEGVFRGFNHATQLKRQPGSAFKPLAVYGPALERGYTPSSILYDGQLDINGYLPKNWDNRTRGSVTLHEAVVNSWNIPAVWLLNEIGIDVGMKFVHDVGIPLTKEDRNLGIALGGLSKGTSPLQMAQAFGMFANLGEMYPAHTITRITTKDGKPLVEFQTVEPLKIMSANHAYTMTLLLQDVVSKGTGKNAALNRPIAGKTGSTQLPDTKEFADIGSNGIKDAWFVGYTPELTAAIWMGYDNTDGEHYLSTSGGAEPAKLFREMMSRALRGVAITPFEIPQDYRSSKENKGKSNDKKEGKGKRGRDDDNEEHDGPKEKGRGKGRKDD